MDYGSSIGNNEHLRYCYFLNLDFSSDGSLDDSLKKATGKKAVENVNRVQTNVIYSTGKHLEC